MRFYQIPEGQPRMVTASQAEAEVERLFRVWLPNTPYAGKAYAVGGYVRDQVLGIDAKDLDVVVGLQRGAEGLTGLIHESFPQSTSNPHQIGAGYPIWSISFKGDITLSGEVFHTAGAEIEVADSQKESFPDPATRQRTTMPGTIEEDIKRRDFTVNMLLRDLSTGELVDLTGTSKADIERGVLRGHPDVDFDKILADDPLRMIRLIRFHVKYGWAIPMDVLRAVRRNADRIGILSGERIRDELIKIMSLGKLREAVRMMHAVGILKHVLPEIEALRKVEQGKDKHPEGDVYKHTLEVLRGVPATVEGQLSALLHDVGKPATRQVIEDRIRFLGHEKTGGEIAETIMRRLKFELPVIKRVRQMVETHMRPYELEGADEKTIRKFIRNVGDDMVDALFELSRADEAATRKRDPVVPALRQRVEEVRKSPIPIAKKPVLNGQQLMELLGIGPGPILGEIGRWLIEQADHYAAEGKVLTPEEAAELVREKYADFFQKKP